MKKRNNGSKLYLLMILITFLSCKKDDDNTPAKTPEQIQIEKLVGTWIPGSVRLDNVDLSNDFSNFELTFNANKTYTCQVGIFAFPANGTWDFVPDNLNQILRDDGVLMSVSVTETSLKLNFTISPINGRLLGVTGDYEFDLVKKQ